MNPYFMRFWSMFYCLHIRLCFPEMNNGMKQLSKKPSSSKNASDNCAWRRSLFDTQNVLRLGSPAMTLALTNCTNDWFSYLLSLSVSLCSHAFLFRCVSKGSCESACRDCWVLGLGHPIPICFSSEELVLSKIQKSLQLLTNRSP